jgi:hypothetical protein
MDRINRLADVQWLRWTGMAVVFFTITGVSTRSVMSALILLVVGALGWVVETRTVRPVRSYFRLLLASATILVLFVTVAEAWVLAVVAWLCMTGLGLVWTIYYERTEPVP